MILDGGPPGGAADLQAVMLENLDVVQAMLRGSDVDWYRGFLREDGRHKDEEPCRDELIKIAIRLCFCVLHQRIAQETNGSS